MITRALIGGLGFAVAVPVYSGLYLSVIKYEGFGLSPVKQGDSLVTQVSKYSSEEALTC